MAKRQQPPVKAASQVTESPPRFMETHALAGHSGVHNLGVADQRSHGKAQIEFDRIDT